MFNNEESASLNLKDLYDKLLEYKVIFIVCLIVCTIFSFVYYKCLVTPRYSSSSVIYVNCMNPEQTTGDGISEYEIQSSRALTTTYMEILCGRTFLNSVSADIGYKYDWRQLASMISISQVNETELLKVNVSALTQEDAYIICKSIVDNAPSKMLAVFKRGTIEVVDEVNMPMLPSTVGMKRIILVGFVMGMLLGVLIAFVLEVFDTKIRTSEELAHRYDITVLGEIFN
ncbi:MAG: hypothetical protein IJ460_02325 [Clostridia bacterium]|nr:hypothetical protein [Clostridia bacterium]